MSAAKEAKQFVERLRALNPSVKIEKGRGGHWLVKRDGGLIGTIPGTPSDVRSLANSAAHFRRAGLVVDSGEKPQRRASGPFGSLPQDIDQVEVAALVRKTLAERGLTRLRFGALVRSEAARLGLIVPSTDHSAEITIGNLLKEGDDTRRVTPNFVEAARAALRALDGDPVVVDATPIEPPPTFPPPVVPTPEPALEPEPAAVKQPEPVSAVEWLDSLAAAVLVRMAMGASTDEQRDDAVALARRVWALERAE